MKKALTRGFVLIILAALAVSSFLNALAFNRELTDEAQNDLRALASGFAYFYNPMEAADMQADEFSASVGGRRVTVIDSQGVVLGDSQADYTSMRNHLDAPEIAKASLTGFGSSIRESQTLGKKLVYAAVKAPDGSYIRVADEVSSVFSSLLSIVPVMLLAMLLALVLSVYTTNRFSNRVLLPVFKMNESLASVKDGGALLDTGRYRYDELVSLAGKINLISKDLSEHIQGIRQEKDKLNYVLDNVHEGFMLLDDELNILIINSTACSYLRCDKSVMGESVYHATRNPVFLRLAQSVSDTGKSEEADMEQDGRIIETVFFRSNGESGFSAGIITTMKDVTDVRTAVKMKRDFFSDASHELKTPITSIKGNAELLCSELDVGEEQKTQLLKRIGLEAARMNSLINDIIMINRMESGELKGDKEDVDVYHLIEDCIEEIRPLAEQEALAVNFKGVPVGMTANRKDLHSLFSNLLVNAVKYNKPGGSVDITLESTENELVFSVRNDGEPIPLTGQSRIFERFYRVDGGRSRAVGGTGLGLAIVKHIADTMEGSVTVRSDSENGTLFTVCLPL